MGIDIGARKPPTIEITMPDGKARSITITGPKGLDFIRHARKVYGLEGVPMDRWSAFFAEHPDASPKEEYISQAVDCLLQGDGADLLGGLSSSVYMLIFAEAWVKVLNDIGLGVEDASSKKANGSPQPSAESCTCPSEK